MAKNLKEITKKKKDINREYLHSVAIHQKYPTTLGELIIFEPWREDYHFSETSYILLIYGNTKHVFYLSFNVSFVELLFLTPSHVNWK